MTDHEKVQQLLRIKEEAPVRFDQPASALPAQRLPPALRAAGVR